MNNYKDIIIRIKEIIDESEKIKQNIPTEELKKSYFQFFMHHISLDIATDFYEEFRELLDEERVFYSLLYSSKDSLLKNASLINICNERILNDENNKEYYQELIQILNNSNNKPAYELAIYNGYIVTKEDLDEFIRLCRMLKVAFGTLTKDTNPEELNSIIQKNWLDRKQQVKRILFLINKLNNLNVEDDNEIYKQASSEVISKEKDDKEKGYSLVNGPYKELLYLGIMGKLNIEMITDLKKVMPKDDFQELVNTLIGFNIFSVEEIEKIETKSMEVINDINELVAFFATKKDLNIEALELLIPSIGQVNYTYLITDLYRLGVISSDDYYNTLRTSLNNKKM